MEVRFPSRIVDRHVGGNTTYARRLARGVEDAGHVAGRLPAASHPLLTAGLETLAGFSHRAGTVDHHTADTGPLVRSRVPSVVTVHGVASRWTDVARTAVPETIWRSRVRAAIRSTHRLITVSRSAADDIAAVFDVDPDAIDVIPHGVEHAAFATPTPLDGRLAHLATTPYVLYLGNIEPRKNITALVEAFSGTSLRASGVRLVVAGRPAWDYEQTLERMDQTENCEFLGFVDDRERAALMQHTGLFVFPSLYEGFGFPVLEALAAGVPVASSRRGSLAEVAGPAWSIEDLTPRGIEESVVAALADEQWCRDVRRTGPRWAAGFTWERSIREHLRIYEEVLR